MHAEASEAGGGSDLIQHPGRAPDEARQRELLPVDPQRIFRPNEVLDLRTDGAAGIGHQGLDPRMEPGHCPGDRSEMTHLMRRVVVEQENRSGHGPSG